MSVTSAHIPVMVKKSVGWSIVLSVLMILAGILGIILPPVAGIVATVFFGWLLLFSGLAHLVFAWHTRGTGAVLWELLIGTAYILVGVYLLLHPVVGMLSLTLVLAIYLFAEGVLEFIIGFLVRGMPGSGWLFFDGFVTLILAIVIWRTWPFNAGWVLGTLLGISMLFSGVARLMISLAARRLATSLQTL
jgi:uncharacterized membrane protein HdeD (DUF308 family)